MFTTVILIPTILPLHWNCSV